MTKTEAKWLARVRDWTGSGRTATQFAEGQDFAPSTLRYWASRLRTKEPALAAAGAPTGEPSGDRPHVRLVQVRRGAKEASETSVPVPAAESCSPSQATLPMVAAGSAPSSAGLVIALGAARIEVRRGFDARLLTDVVVALRGGQ